MTRGLQLVDDKERERLQGIALEQAAMSDGMKVIDLLSRCRATFDSDSLSRAFEAAASYDAVSVLIYLIEMDHDKCLQIEHSRRAFTSAAMRGDTVLQFGSPTFSRNHSSLLHVRLYGHCETSDLRHE